MSWGEVMGTARDWMSAAFWGMLWAAVPLLWEILSRSDNHIKPILLLEDVLSLAIQVAAWLAATFFGGA